MKPEIFRERDGTHWAVWPDGRNISYRLFGYDWKDAGWTTTPVRYAEDFISEYHLTPAERDAILLAHTLPGTKPAKPKRRKAKPKFIQIPVKRWADFMILIGQDAEDGVEDDRQASKEELLLFLTAIRLEAMSLSITPPGPQRETVKKALTTRREIHAAMRRSKK